MRSTLSKTPLSRAATLIVIAIVSTQMRASSPFILQDIGTLGNQDSVPVGMNEAGQVVGALIASDGYRHAFIWDAVNGTRDLGAQALGATASEGVAINAGGVITGSYYTEDPNGGGQISQAFVWDAANGMRPVGSLAGQMSWARWVDDTGRVFGQTHEVGGIERLAFVWDATTGDQFLGALGGINSELKAVNRSGTAAGWAWDVNNEIARAFVWDPVNGQQDLGAPDNVEPRLINEAGVVAGVAYGPTAALTFVWDQVGGYRELPTLGGTYTIPSAINSAGQVTGQASTNGDTEWHVFFWDPSTGMRDVGRFNGLDSQPFAISDAGHVVGHAYQFGVPGGPHGFIWDSINGMQALGTLGGSRSEAWDVNASGQVVGDSADAAGNRRAFIWDATNGMRDLGTLGGSQSQAFAISDTGLILGVAAVPGDLNVHGFLASVPLEPPGPDIPEVTSGPASGTVDQGFVYGITASNNPTSFGAQDLPAGLTVDPASGLISGTPIVAGTFAVTLTATNATGTGTGQLTLTIAKGAASVTLHDLNPVYDGSPKPVGVTTAPADLSVTVLYAGSPSAPVAAGSYAVDATVVDDNYQGSASATLTIAKATQTIAFGPIANKTFGDAPFTLTAAASSTLTVSFSIENGPATIAGNTLTITGAGDVTVRATQLGDTNYFAAAPVEQSFSVAKAPAIVTISNTSQTADGTPKPVTVTTTPAGLPTIVTYNGSTTPPSAVGAYAVVATVNDANYQGSQSATLTISAPAGTAPQITSHPVSLTRIAGQSASFAVRATGTAPLTYQWRKNGTPIAGATARTFTIAAVTAADAAVYSVTVSNSGGSVTSNGATLTVLVRPTIVTQPASTTVAVGGTAVLSVVANGSTPLFYQWVKGFSLVPGATSATLMLTNVQPSAAGLYRVIVFNAAGFVISQPAVLTVQ